MENYNFSRPYAFEAHKHQTYGDLPYSYHLELVAQIAQQFAKLLDEYPVNHLMTVAYLHDIIEDCTVTYNDIKNRFGEEVAESVYSLTNEKGRNRKERANDKYYEGIRNNDVARFIKACDRIANSLHSCMFNNKMFEMYRKEFKEFSTKLDLESKLFPMFKTLEVLYNTRVYDFKYKHNEVQEINEVHHGNKP